jgi:hypothetical protein
MASQSTYTPERTQTIETAAAPARRTKRQLLAAVGLFFLAPLVGEFLLGNLPITWLWALISLAPLYGGGALLIRETARRLRLGWPSIVILGLTYAVIEEAFITQSLFNPNYVGLRLLDYGYISSLGIGAWWTVFVLAIHTVWSTSVPIALVEGMTPAARRTPWLGPVGLVITVLIFAFGCVSTFVFQQGDPFQATAGQWIGSGVVVVILIAMALLLGRQRADAPITGPAPPSTMMVGGVTFVLSSLFMVLVNLSESMPVALNVGGMLFLFALGSWLLWQWSQRPGWAEPHRVAAAGGLLLTYAWYGFVQVPSVPGTSPLIDAIGNAVFASGALILLVIAWRRASVASPAYAAESGNPETS